MQLCCQGRSGINMSGLWRYNEKTKEGKYLVKRRDGSIPKWPYIVLGAADPTAPAALLAYSNKCRELGFNHEYVTDLVKLSIEFEDWRLANKDGDPDAPEFDQDYIKGKQYGWNLAIDQLTNLKKKLLEESEGK